MRTIAIINQKGGCGKTTVSINLAAVLAARGQRTLLVDMDPQAHCALGLAVPENQIERTVGDCLRAGLDGSLPFADIVWQISRNLDLAPSTMDLAGIEAELHGLPDRDRRLTQLLSTVADKYDVCIVDCPPAIGLLTFNALRAAAEVIIPVETGYFALQGAMRQEATIEMLARRAHHQCRLKVLATMYDVRIKLAREILSELRKHFGEKLLPVVVHFNSKLKEAASFGQAITEYDAASRGHQDFDKLADWLFENPPAEPEPIAEMTTQQAASSRAAELVERARALAVRTANLTARLNADAEVAAATGRLPQTAPTVPATPADKAPAADEPATTNLRQKLSRLFGVQPTAQGLLFVLPANFARSVAIAGDFNNWSPSATPMRRDAQLGVWQACVPVQPGRYRYRLVVDGKWINDPYNSYVETNPFGELNSVIEVQQAQ